MTQMQRILLTLGFIGIMFLCLCPPYQWERTNYIMRGLDPQKAEVTIENAGHYWIWDPPRGFVGEARQNNYTVRVSNNARIDWSRLGIYVGVIAGFILFAAFVVFRKKE